MIRRLESVLTLFLVGLTGFGSFSGLSYAAQQQEVTITSLGAAPTHWARWPGSRSSRGPTQGVWLCRAGKNEEGVNTLLAELAGSVTRC